MSANVSTPETGKPGMHPFLRALLGLLLLFPACGLCSINLLGLSLQNFMGSLRSFSYTKAGGFIGIENYSRLFNNPRLSSMFGYTFSIIIVHVLLAALPLLMVLLVNTFGKKLKLGVRLFFTLPLAFFGPVLVMYGPGYIRSLWATDSPENSYLLIDALAGLALACGVGMIVYFAVLRSQEVEGNWKIPWKPLIITWLIAQFATVAYVIQSFNMLSGLLSTRGSNIPGNFLFQTIRQIQGGVTFAFSTIILFVISLLGVAAALLLILGRVQLKVEPREETADIPPVRGVLNITGWVALVIGGIAVLLVSVLPWFLALFRSVTALQDGFGSISILQVWMNSLLPSLLLILFIQLPVAYLGALGIGVTRPFGNASKWLLLLFSPWLFVTPLSFGFASLLNMREFKLLNTLFALTPSVLVSVPMIFVFTLFFIGQGPKWQEARAAGGSAISAFFKQLVIPSLPIVVLMVAFSLLVGVQDLFTPSTTGVNPKLYTATTAMLVSAATHINSGTPALILILFGLPVSFFFFIVFAALQVFYLDRLKITYEANPKEQAPKEVEPANP